MFHLHGVVFPILIFATILTCFKFYSQINFSLHIIQNGMEATRRLRALGHRNLIIGVTANVMASEVRAFYDSGLDMVVLKPMCKGLVDLVVQFVQKHGFASHPNRKFRVLDEEIVLVDVNNIMD